MEPVTMAVLLLMQHPVRLVYRTKWGDCSQWWHLGIIWAFLTFGHQLQHSHSLIDVAIISSRKRVSNCCDGIAICFNIQHAASNPLLSAFLRTTSIYEPLVTIFPSQTRCLCIVLPTQPDHRHVISRNSYTTGSDSTRLEIFHASTRTPFTNGKDFKGIPYILISLHSNTHHFNFSLENPGKYPLMWSVLVRMGPTSSRLYSSPQILVDVCTPMYCHCLC